MNKRLIATNICDRCGFETETCVINLGEKILFETIKCVCNICIPGSLWHRSAGRNWIKSLIPSNTDKEANEP